MHPQRNVVATGSFQPGCMPGVLDFPVVRRYQKATHHRLPVRAGDRLAVLGDLADCAHPIGVLAAAGERPSAVDPKAVGRRLCRSGRLGRSADSHIGSILIDAIVDFASCQGCEKTASARHHRGPAERAAQPGKSGNDLKPLRQSQLQPVMTPWHENTKHADRSQPIHQVGRNAARRFDLGRACGDLRRQFSDAGKQILVCGARCEGTGMTKRALKAHLFRTSREKNHKGGCRRRTTGRFQRD